jgi:DNA-binding response OmpR family regulator
MRTSRHGQRLAWLKLVRLKPEDRREPQMVDVLVVDDDDFVRESIAEALTHAGYVVAQASDGEKAMSLVASCSFDIAICDVRMPRLSGLTLLRRLRREAPSISVVIMSSFAKISDVVDSLREGAVDYVTKPFDPDEFARNVVGPIAEQRGREFAKGERGAAPEYCEY